MTAELLGIGNITASAVVATVDDFTQFKSANQFGGWAGLAPSQNSSGGNGQQERAHRVARDDTRGSV